MNIAQIETSEGHLLILPYQQRGLVVLDFFVFIIFYKKIKKYKLNVSISVFTEIGQKNCTCDKGQAKEGLSYLRLKMFEIILKIKWKRAE